ncbi:leucine-rich repeat transmembrane protein CCDC168 [Rhynchocyon petersi]
MPKQYHFFNKGMRDGLEENTFFMLWDFLESWIFQNEWTAIIFMIFLIIIFEIVLLKFCTFFQKKLKFPEKKHSDTEKNEYKSLQSETLDNWSLTCSSFEERITGSTSENEDLDVAPCPPAHFYLSRDQIKHLEENVRSQISLKSKASLQSKSTSRSQESLIQDHDSVGMSITAPAQDSFLGQNAIENPVQQCVQNEESINSQPTIKVRYITQPQDLMKKPFPSSTQDSFHVQYLDRCRHYVQVPHSVEIQDSVQSPVSGKEHSEEAQYSMWFEDSNENKYLIKGKNAILKNADILVLALCPNAVAEEATQLKNIKPNRQLQSASSKSTHNSVNSSVPLSPTIKGQKNRRKTSESKHKLSRKVPSIKAKKTSHSRVFQITVCHTAKRTKELGSNHSTEMKVFHQIEDTADVALHLICVSKFVPPYMKKYFRKKIVKVMPDLTKHSHFLWKQNKSPDADKIDYIDNTGISGIIENLKEHGTEDEGLRNISPKILLWLKQSFKVNTCQFKTPSYSVMETDWENQEPPEDLIGVAELHTPNSKTVVQHFPKLETPLKEVVRDPMQTFLSSPKMESSRKIKTQGDPKMTVNSHVPLLQRENSLTSASEMQRSFPQRNTQDGKDHLKIVVETSNVNMRISLRTKKHKRNSKLANIKIQTSADDVIFEEKKHSDSDNSSPSEEMECNATYKVKNIHADRSDTFQNAACSTASEPPNLEMYRGKSETGTSGIIKHSQSTIEPEKPPDEDKICNAKHIDKEFIREIFQNLPQRDREELEALKEAVAQLTQEFLHLKQHPKNVKSEIRESCSESRKTPNEEQAIHPLTLSTKDILKPVPWHTMEPFKVEKPEHGTNRHTGREYTAEPNMPLTLPENFSDGELLIETTECGVADDHTEGINENFKRLLPKLQNEVNKETLPQTVACESGHLRFEAYPVKELKTEKEMNQHFPCTTMVSTYSPIMDPSPIKNMEKILTAPADVKYTEGSQTHLPTSETPLTGDPGDPGHYQAETGYHITEKIESSKDLLATSPETLLFSVLSLSHPKRPKKRLAHKKRIVRPNCLLRKAVKPSISQILIIASHRFGHRKYLGSNSKAKMKKIKQVSKLVDGFLNTIYGPLYERLEAEIERCCHACLKQRELADKERSKIVDCFDHSSVLYGRVEKAQDGEEEEENDLPEAVPQHTRQPRSDASQRKELCLAVNHLAHKMPIDEQDTQHQTGFPEIVFEASPTMGFREAEKRQKTNQPENDVQVPVGPKALLPKAGDSTLNKLLDSRTEYDSPPGGNHHRELDSYFMEGNSELPKGWKCTPLQSSFQSSVSESKRQNKALSNIQTAMSCKCKTMKVKKRPISCMYNERYSRRCHFFMKMKNPPQSKLVADAHLDAIHSMAPILPNIKMSSSLKETKEQMREVTTLDHVHVSQGKSPNGSQMWFPEPISMKSISSSIKYGEEEEEQHEALPSPVDNQNFMFSTSQKMDRGLVKSEDELNQLGRNQVQTQSRQTDLYSISSPPVNKLQLEKLEKCIDILPPMSEESKMEDIILSAREYSAPSDGNHQKEQDSVILKKKAVTFDVSSPTLCTSKQMNFKPSSDMKMAVLPKCGILKAEKPLGSHTFSIKGGTSTDPRKQLQCKLATKMNEIQQEEKMMENTCPFIHIKPALKEKLETDTFLNTSCHSMPAPSDVGGNKKLKAEVEMLRQTINLMQIKQEKSNDRKAWDIYSTDWKWSSKDVIKKPLEDNENQKIIPKEIPPSIQGCAPDTYQRKKPDLVKLKNDCPGERSFCNFLVKEQNMQQQTSFPKIVLDSTSYLMNLFQAEKMKEGPQTHKDLQVPHSAEVPPSKLATANLSHETTEGDTELTGTLQKTLGSHIAEDKIELVERLRTPLLKHLDFFTPVSYDPENEIHPTKLSERKITMHPKYLTMKAKKPPFSQSIKIIRQFPTKHRMKMTSTLKNKMREVLSGKNAADGFPETLYFTLDELAIKKKRRFTTQVGTTRVSRFNQPQLPHMDSPPTLIERHLDSIGKGGAENILKEAEVHDGESEQERQEYLMDMGPMCTKTSMINAYLIMEPDPDTSEGATLSESFSPEAQTYTGNSEKPSETDKIKNMKNNLKIGLPDIEKSGIYSELSESMGDAKSSKSDKKRMGNSVLKEYQYDSLAGLILNSIVRHLPALQTIQMHNGSLKIAGMPNASSKGISLKVKQSLNTKGHVVLSTEKKQAHNLKAPKKGEKDKAASSALRKPLCLPVSNSPNMGMEQSPSLGDTDAESSDQSNVLNKAESREKEKHDLEVFLRTASQYAQTVGFRTGQNRECGPFRFEVPFSNRTVPESITPQKTEITLIDQKMKGKCVKETSAMFDISSKICQPHIEKQKMEFENANCQTIAIPKVMVTQTEKPFTGARFLNTMMCGESFQHREEKVEWEDHLALEKRQQKPDISGNIWSSADAHTLMDPKIAKHNNKVKIADGKNIMHSKQVKLKMKRAPASQLRNGEYGIRNGKKELTYTKQGKSCHKSTNVVALVLKAIHESGCITSHVPNLTEVIKREKEKPIFPQLKLEKPCHRRQTLSLESVNTSSNYKNTRQQYIQQLRTSSNQIKRCHHVKVKDLQRKVCFEPTSQKRRSDYTAVDIQGSRRGKEVFVKRQETQQQNPFLQQDMKKLEMVPGTSLGSSPYTMKETLHLNKTVEIRSKQFSIPQMKKESMLTNMLSSSDEEQFLISGVKAQQQKPLTSIMLASMSSYILDQLHTEKPEEETQRKGLFLKGSAQHGKYISNKVCISSVDVVSRSIEKLLLLIKEQEKKRKNIRKGKEFEIAALVKAKMNFSPVLEYSPAGAHFINTKEHVGTFKQRNEEGLDKSVATQRGQDRLWGRGIFLESVYTNEPLSPETVFHEDKRIETVKCTTCPKKAKIKANKTLIFQLLYITGSGTRRNKKELRCNIKRQKTEFRQSENVADFIRKTTDGSECAPSHMREYREVKREKHKKKKLILISPQLKVNDGDIAKHLFSIPRVRETAEKSGILLNSKEQNLLFTEMDASQHKTVKEQELLKQECISTANLRQAKHIPQEDKRSEIALKEIVQHKEIALTTKKSSVLEELPLNIQEKEEKMQEGNQVRLQKKSYDFIPLPPHSERDTRIEGKEDRERVIRCACPLTLRESSMRRYENSTDDILSQVRKAKFKPQKVKERGEIALKTPIKPKEIALKARKPSVSQTLPLNGEETEKKIQEKKEKQVDIQNKSYAPITLPPHSDLNIRITGEENRAGISQSGYPLTVRESTLKIYEKLADDILSQILKTMLRPQKDKERGEVALYEMAQHQDRALTANKPSVPQKLSLNIEEKEMKMQEKKQVQTLEKSYASIPLPPRCELDTRMKGKAHRQGVVRSGCPRTLQEHTTRIYEESADDLLSQIRKAKFNPQRDNGRGGRALEERAQSKGTALEANPPSVLQKLPLSSEEKEKRVQEDQEEQARIQSKPCSPISLLSPAALDAREKDRIEVRTSGYPLTLREYTMRRYEESADDLLYQIRKAKFKPQKSNGRGEEALKEMVQPKEISWKAKKPSVSQELSLNIEKDTKGQENTEKLVEIQKKSYTSIPLPSPSELNIRIRGGDEDRQAITRSCHPLILQELKRCEELADDILDQSRESKFKPQEDKGRGEIILKEMTESKETALKTKKSSSSQMLLLDIKEKEKMMCEDEDKQVKIPRKSPVSISLPPHAELDRGEEARQEMIRYGYPLTLREYTMRRYENSTGDLLSQIRKTKFKSQERKVRNKITFNTPAPPKEIALKAKKPSVSQTLPLNGEETEKKFQEKKEKQVDIQNKSYAPITLPPHSDLNIRITGEENRAGISQSGYPLTLRESTLKRYEELADDILSQILKTTLRPQKGKERGEVALYEMAQHQDRALTANKPSVPQKLSLNIEEKETKMQEKKQVQTLEKSYASIPLPPRCELDMRMKGDEHRQRVVRSGCPRTLQEHTTRIYEESADDLLSQIRKAKFNPQRDNGRGSIALEERAHPKGTALEANPPSVLQKLPLSSEEKEERVQEDQVEQTEHRPCASIALPPYSELGKRMKEDVLIKTESKSPQQNLRQSLCKTKPAAKKSVCGGNSKMVTNAKASKIPEKGKEKMTEVMLLKQKKLSFSEDVQLSIKEQEEKVQAEKDKSSVVLNSSPTSTAPPSPVKLDARMKTGGSTVEVGRYSLSHQKSPGEVKLVSNGQKAKKYKSQREMDKVQTLATQDNIEPKDRDSKVEQGFSQDLSLKPEEQKTMNPYAKGEEKIALTANCFFKSFLTLHELDKSVHRERYIQGITKSAVVQLQLQKSLGEEQTTHIQSSGGDSSNDVKRVHEYKPQRGEDRGKILSVEYAMYSKGPTSMAKTFPLPRVFRFAGVEPQTRAVPMSRREPMGCVPERKDAQDEVKTVPPPPPHKVDTGVERKNKFKVNKSFLLPPWHMDSLGARKGKYTKLPLNYFERAKHMMHKEMDTVNVTVNKDKMHPKYITWRAKKSPLSQIFNTNKLQMNIKERERSGQEGRSETAVTLSKACAVGTPSTSLTLDTMKEDLSGLRNLVPRIELQESLASQQIASTESMETNTLSNAKQSKKLSQKEGRVTAVAMNRLMHPKERIFKAKMLLYSHVFTITGGGSPGSIFSKRKKTQRNIKRKAGRELERTGEPDVVLRKILTPMLSRPACRLITNIKIDRRCRLSPSPPIYLKQDTRMSQKGSTPGTRPPLKCQAPSDSGKKANAESTDEFMLSNKKGSIQFRTQKVEESSLKIGVQDKMLPRYIWEANKLQVESRKPERKGEEGKNEQVIGVQTIYVSIVTPPHLKFDTAEGEEYVVRITKLPLAEQKSQESSNKTAAYLERVDGKLSSDIKAELMLKEGREKTTDVNGIVDPNNTYLKAKKSSHLRAHNLTDLQWKNKEQKEKAQEGKGGPDTMLTKMRASRSSHSQHIISNRVKEVVCTEPTTGDISNSLKKGGKHMPEEMEEDGLAAVNIIMPSKHQENKVPECNDGLNMALPKPSTSLPSRPHLKLDKDIQVDEEMLGITGSVLQRICNTRGKEHEALTHGEVSKDIRDLKQHMPQEEKKNAVVLRQATHPIDITSQTKKLLPSNILHRTELHLNIRSQGKKEQETQTKPPCETLRELHTVEPSSLTFSASPYPKKTAEIQATEGNRNKEEKHVSLKEARKLKAREMGVKTACKCSKVSPISHMLSIRELVLNLRQSEGNNHKGKDELCVVLTKTFLSRPLAPPLPMDSGVKMDINTPETNGLSATLQNPQESSDSQKLAERKPLSGGGKRCFQKSEHQVPQKETARQCTLNLLISLQQREECPRVKSEGDLPRLVLNSQEEGLYFTGVGSVRSRKTLGWFVTEQNAQPGKYKRETFTTLLSCPTKRPTKTGDTKKGTDLKKNLDHTLMHTKILGPLPKKIAKEMNIPAGTPLCSKGHELSVSEQVILSKPSSEYVGLPKSIMLKQDVPSNKKISNMSSSQVLASPEKAPSEKMHVSELNIPQSTEEEMFLEKQVVRQSEGESKSVPNPTLSLRFSLLIGKQKAVLEIDVGGKTALPPEVLRLQDVRDITEPDGAGREKEPTLTVSELVRCVLESFLKSLAPHLAFLFQCRDMEGESGNDTRTAINMEQKTLEMDINSTLGQEGEAFILDANNTTHQKEGERKFSKDTTVNLEKQKMKMDTNHAGKMHSPPLKAEESQIKTPAVTHVINNCPTKQNHKNTQEWSAKRNLKSPKYPQKTVLDSFYAYIPLTTKFESQKHRLTIKDLARELRPNYLTMKVPNHPVSQFLSIIGHGTPSNRMKLEYNFDKHKQMALGPKDTSGIVIRSLSISMMSSPHNKKAVKSEKNLEREQGVCLSKSKERSPNADRIARRGNTVGEGHQNFRKSPEECQPFIADEQRAKTFFNVKLTNSCEEISKTNLTPQTEIAVQGHDASKMIGEPYSLKPKDCVDARMDSVINRNIPAQGIEKAQHGQHLFDTSRWVSQPCRMDPNGTIWNTAAQKMKQQKALSDTVHKSTCTHMPVPSSFKSNGLKIVTDGTGTERSLPVYEETENILESQGKNIAERNQPTVIQRYVPVTSVNVKITGTVAADQLKKVQHCTLDNLKSPAFPEGPGPIAITHPRLQPKVFADLSTEDKNKLSNHLEVKGLEIKHNLIPEIVTKSLQKINADPQQPISGEDSRWGLYPRYKTMSFVSPEGIDCIELDLKQREPPISCMKTLTVNVSSGDKEIITQLNNIDKVVLGGKSSVIPAGNTTPSCHSQQSRKKDKLLMHFSIKTLEIQMAAFPKIVEESFSMAHVQNKEAHLSKCIHSGAKSLEHRNRILLCFEKTSLHNIDLDLQYEDLCFLLGLTAENMPPKQKALSSHGLSKSIVGTKVDDAVKSCDHAVVRAQSEEQSSFKKQSPHKCLSLIRKCPEPTPRFPSDAHLPSMVLKETSVVSKSKSHATLEEEKEYHVWFQQKNTYKSFDLKTQGNVSLTDIHSLPISENGTVDVQKHVDSATNSEEWSSLQVSESEEYIFLDVCSSLSEGPESTSFDLQEAVPLGTVCPKENVKTDLKQFYKADAGSHDISRRKHTLVVPPPPYKPHKNNEYRSSSKRQSPDWFCHSSLKTTAIQPMSSISFSEEKLSWTAGNKTDDYLAPLTESNIKLHLEKHQEDYLMHSGSREKRKHKSDSLRKHCVHFNSDCSYTHQEKRTRKKKRHDYETESSGWYSQSSCTSSSDHQQKFTDLGSSTKQSKPFFYACMPADSLEVTPKTIRWTVPMKTLRKKNFRIPLVAKMSNSWNIWSLSKKWLESFTGSFS